MGGKYFYFVEGDCEKKLLDALKQSPSLIKSGKVKVHNVIQNIIPESLLFTIKTGTTVGKTTGSIKLFCVNSLD